MSKWIQEKVDTITGSATVLSLQCANLTKDENEEVGMERRISCLLA